MTLQSQGIVVEGGAAEVSTDAGQPQVHEEDEEQCTGPADGIVEEIVPNITCQWMTNLTNRISCHLMTGFSITKPTSQTAVRESFHLLPTRFCYDFISTTR